MRIGQAALVASALLVVLINARSTSTQRMSRLATTKTQTAPTKSLPQDVAVVLPLNLNNAENDRALLKESAVVISIPSDDRIYVGSERIPKERLGSKISDLLKQQAEPGKIVYIAGGVGVDYGAVVDVILIIRRQKVRKIGLIAGRKLTRNDESRLPYPPERFLMEIPIPFEEEDIRNLKPNPLTLVVAISGDLKLKINNRDRPDKWEPCYGLVPEYGSVNEPDHLVQCLNRVFTRRYEEHAYKPSMETRSDLPESQRIEKTVFVKAPRSIRYGDVVSAIDAIKGAGADPIGLQIDDLPQ